MGQKSSFKLVSLKMKTQDVQKLYDDYILPTYARLPLCLVKGKGAKVWDLEGKVYLDFFPGWAVSGIGHSHPAVVNAIKHQAKSILHVSNNFLNIKQARLAEEIVRCGFPGRVFFCNSGTEATEGAVKFARKFGSDTGRFEIITLTYSFHGRSSAGIAATAQDKVRKGFDPILPGFKYAEFNDLDSVKKQITDKTVAVFLEPVQGEGGVNVATPEFMKGLRKICDEKNLLLMLDEVQCGMGRTGKMFAYQNYEIEPDVMTLAKTFGGGVPIGAFVVHKKIQKELFTPGTHGSTYGGNPLVCAAALAVFKTIQQEKLLTHATQLGKYLGERLEAMKARFSVIEKVKGIAMMRGLSLKEPGQAIVDRAREKGLLINCTQDKVLRILPPINISKSLLDQGLKILESVFEELQAAKK